MQAGSHLSRSQGKGFLLFAAAHVLEQLRLSALKLRVVIRQRIGRDVMAGRALETPVGNRGTKKHEGF